MDFSKAFRHEGQRSRDKFISRLFGIFSEEIVKVWASEDTPAPYRDLGKPTLKTEGEVVKRSRGKTLDFILEEKKTDRRFVCEQKCELEFEGYKFLELRSRDQLRHHEQGAAFRRFLDLARNPRNYQVFVRRAPIENIQGIILLWGKVSESGRAEVKDKCQVYDVLSLEAIVNDLLAWKSSRYLELVEQRRGWCGDLFSDLTQTGK